MIETITDLMRDAVINNGGTYWVSVQRNRFFVGKSELDSGFYVGTDGNGWCLSHSAFSGDKVNDFIVQNMSALLDNGRYFLGIWRSPESGRWYLDVSEHIRDAAYALAIASERKELAIWDIAHQTEIPVNGIDRIWDAPNSDWEYSKEKLLSY